MKEVFCQVTINDDNNDNCGDENEASDFEMMFL